MIDLIFYIFFVASGVHLIACFANVWWRNNSFQMALLINTFPFLMYGQQSQNELRFYGVPYGYFPIIASGLPYILKYLKFGILGKGENYLKYPFVCFLIYCTVRLILSKEVIESLPYLLSWLINILLLLSIWWAYKNEKIENLQIFILRFVNILIICSLIGLIKYFLGFAADANFMPMFNRNATLIFVCVLVPLIPALWSWGVMSAGRMIFNMLVIFLTLIFIESRSGLIALVYAIIFSLYRAMRYKNKSNLKIFSIYVVLLLTGLLIFINTSISERFGYLSNTIGALSSGDNVQSGEQDFDRTMLLAFAFELIQNNPLIGVGIGLANYQRGLEDIGVNFHRLSKSHNFYVSYLAELGVFGLSILFFAFFRIYRVLKVNAFGVQCFKTAAILLIFNEYILLPELWYFFGLLLAIVSSAENKIKEIKYER